MKKSILNIGKALNKAEQKTVNGGKGGIRCTDDSHCPSHMFCGIFLGWSYGLCQKKWGMY